MTNLNPNGTGMMIPNQYTNKDMSFVPPPPSVTGPGFQDATFSPVDNDGLMQNKPQIVDLARVLGDTYKGCYWWRVAINYSQQGYRQVGTYSRDNGKRADGALWSDGRSYLCLPPLTASTTLGNATVDRVSSANFVGQHVFTYYEVGAAMLYKETSATNPTPIAVAGYTAPGAQTTITAIRSILVNGINYLAVCFYVPGAANSVQVISDLANPPTGLAATIPTGFFPTFDLIQTAIDGNALLIYLGNATGGGEIRAIRTDVGVGTVALSSPRCSLAPGGYAVGLSEAEDENPMAYWVEPQDNLLLLFTPTAGQNRGRLIKTDARGYLPVTVDVPLAWTTFATKWRGGIVCCDTQTHWYLNKDNPRGKWRRMSVYDDLPANSDKQYVCCGHREKDGKFLIETNETITTSGTGNTSRYTMEFDYDSWQSTRIEVKQALSTTGILSRGGAHLPWSPFSNYTQSRAQTSWYRQRVGPLGENLFNMRKTAGAAAGTGVEYASEETLTLPAMDIDGLETYVKTLTAIEGPTAAAVAYGGTGAYVGVEELLSGRTGFGSNGNGAQFFGTEPAQRIQRREYKPAPGSAQLPWTYQIQPRITIVRQSGGTDPTRQTPNAFNNGIYMEGLAVRDPITAPVASILKAMDRQRTRPIP